MLDYKFGYIFTLLSVLLTAVLYWSGAYDSLEKNLYDYRFKLRKPLSGDYVSINYFTGNGVWDEGEYFTDQNGVCDKDEKFTDSNKNRVWDWIDSNENHICDNDECEEFVDGNGQYDKGEDFIDEPRKIYLNNKALKRNKTDNDVVILEFVEPGNEIKVATPAPTDDRTTMKRKQQTIKRRQSTH